MTEAEVMRRNIERYEQTLQTRSVDAAAKQKIREMLKEFEDKLANLRRRAANPTK